VENVAVGVAAGWVVAGDAGRATVVEGDDGGRVGSGVSGPSGVVTGGLGLGGTDRRPPDAVVEVDLPVARLVAVVGGSPPGEPDCSSLTTSRWATTGGGRSVTSAATVDVAVQTTPVDATVAVNHSPVAKNLGADTRPGCPLRWRRGLSHT
jgi:hypothetical protein